jgi:hypothetical protein
VLAGYLITSPSGVDVVGDTNVTADLLGLLSNTRFAYAGGDKRRQAYRILCGGHTARQSELEGTYAAELRAGHAKNAQGAYAFIHNSALSSIFSTRRRTPA